jgi:hypothetical protein
MSLVKTDEHEYFEHEFSFSKKSHRKHRNKVLIEISLYRSSLNYLGWRHGFEHYLCSIRPLTYWGAG